jgi:hypothetical protein
MGIQVSLHHSTGHQYEHATTLGAQVIRLHPAPNSRIPIRHHSLGVTSGDRLLKWQINPFCNQFAGLFFLQKTKECNCPEANPIFPETFDLHIKWPASKNEVERRETLP